MATSMRLRQESNATELLVMACSEYSILQKSTKIVKIYKKQTTTFSNKNSHIHSNHPIKTFVQYMFSWVAIARKGPSV